jgi:hypothetical protein
MKSTWSGMMCLSAALAAMPASATAAEPWPHVSPEFAAQLEQQRGVILVSGQANPGTTPRSTIGFVSLSSDPIATTKANAGGSGDSTPAFRQSPPRLSNSLRRQSIQSEPERVDTASVQQCATEYSRTTKAAVPRLMSEPYPAPLEDLTDPPAADDGESQTVAASGNLVTSPRAASQPLRVEVIDNSDARMALAADKPPEMGPSLQALQDQVPSSCVEIEGRVGAINLGDQTVKLNFDRQPPPPLGGLVKVYQVQAGGTTCIGAVRIIRVYGGVATGSPVGNLRVEGLVAGDLVGFHVDSTIAGSHEPDPREAVWVDDRVNETAAEIAP